MASREDTPTSSRWSRGPSAGHRGSTPGDNLEGGAIRSESGHVSKRPKSKSTGAAASSAFPTVGKIRHLKKEDGEPLWRRDIQYDFLKAVFDDDTQVFTNSYEPIGDDKEKQSFADLYIDTMARSSKTSKVLRDKLLSDREAAKSMAMVCLLVNVGRMNTTLNCINSPPSIYWYEISLTILCQSSPRCEPSFEHITLSPRCRLTKMHLPTSNFRMRQD